MIVKQLITPKSPKKRKSQDGENSQNTPVKKSRKRQAEKDKVQASDLEPQNESDTQEARSDDEPQESQDEDNFEVSFREGDTMIKMGVDRREVAEEFAYTDSDNDVDSEVQFNR